MTNPGQRHELIVSNAGFALEQAADERRCHWDTTVPTRQDDTLDLDAPGCSVRLFDAYSGL